MICDPVPQIGKVQPKNFTAKVEKHPNPEVYKDRILTAFFQSGIVTEIVKGICFRNHIKNTTYIHEDVAGETWYYICRRPALEIIEMYESNPDRLVGLAVRIAVLKGVAKNVSNEDYHKHSIARHILFASNLGQHENLSSTGEKEDGDGFSQEIADETEDKSFEKIWQEIEAELKPEQVEFMYEYFEMPKRRGALKKDVKDRLDNLLSDLKAICERKGLKNFSR